jgi:uncharacterized damage-inducible protein DinB
VGDDDRTLVAQAQIDDGSLAVDLIARYMVGPARLEAALAGMTPEHLHARPLPGKMTTIEVVAHVADCEQFLADRMKRTIAMDRPLLMSADGSAYVEALHYDDRDVALDVRLVAATREQIAADLRRIPPEAWERTGVHSENGLVTLRQLLLHTIRHLERHVAAIDEKRAALGL